MPEAFSALPFQPTKIEGHIYTLPVIDVREAINTVEINPEAKKFLGDTYGFLTDPQFIERFAAISAPPEKATSQAQSPFNWTRSLIEPSYEPIIYGPARHKAKIIQSKGNGYTGRSYGKTISQDPDRFHLDSYRWGFLSADKAQEEMYIANRLIANSVPAGLVLGHVELDGHKLHQLISSAYDSYPDLRNDILGNLNKMLEKGEKPDVMVRLTDSTVRLYDYINANNIHEALEHFCFFDPQLKEQFFQIFQHAQTQRRLPESTLLHELIESTKNHIKIQANAFEKVLHDEDFKKEYKHLALSASAAKDVSLGLTSIDFDEARQYGHYDAAYADLTPDQLKTIYEERLNGNTLQHYKRILDHIYDYSPYTEEDDDPEYYQWREAMKKQFNVF